MTHFHTSVLLRALSVAAIVSATAGCTTNPFKGASPREEASHSIDATAIEVAATRSRIDVAVRSFQEILDHPGTDLNRQMKNYTDAVAQLRSSADKLRNRATAMQSRGQEYFVEWDREIAGIRDEELRTRSTERRDEVASRFDEIREHYVEAREALQPLLTRLDETRTALAVDLTAAGVSSIRSSTGNLSDEAAPAREALDDLAESLRRAGVALAPSGITSRTGSGSF